MHIFRRDDQQVGKILCSSIRGFERTGIVCSITATDCQPNRWTAPGLNEIFETVYRNPGESTTTFFGLGCASGAPLGPKMWAKKAGRERSERPVNRASLRLARMLRPYLRQQISG
jgi:hypothetical protein